MVVNNEDIFLMDMWSSSQGLSYIVGMDILSKNEAEVDGLIGTLDGKIYSSNSKNAHQWLRQFLSIQCT